MCGWISSAKKRSFPGWTLPASTSGRPACFAMDSGMKQWSWITWNARRAEELDVVASGHERVAQQRQHELDAAVPGRRDRDPRRSEHRESQAPLLRHRFHPVPRPGSATSLC
jgi:hypothetical protein